MILHEIQKKEIRLTADELRYLVFHNESILQYLWNRRDLLNEREFIYFKRNNQVSEYQEKVASLRNLGNYVIGAAEGIEAQRTWIAEFKIQVIGLALALAALIALFIDIYDFVQGQPSEPLKENARRVIYLTAVLALVFAVGVGVGRRLKGSS